MGSILRRATAPDAEGRVVGVTPADVGWRFIHFSAHRLAAGARLVGATNERETALVLLGGSATVRASGRDFGRIGSRRDVWERVPPPVVLLPPSATYEITAATDLHLAIAGAPVECGVPARAITPAEIASERRGAGQTERHVQHLLPPSAEAARLILVEVYTPAGNWSSFPPHKHDADEPPEESYLEETYYYQVNPRSGFALQRVYTPDRSVDESVAVEDGDLVLVPRGYHVVAATPGHECYYLNVMAGPTRAWNFRVDPDYAALMNWSKPAVAEAAR